MMGWVVAGVLAVCALVSLRLVGRAQYRRGWGDGMAETSERVIAARHGKHAAGMPRTDPGPGGPAGQGSVQLPSPAPAQPRTYPLPAGFGRQPGEDWLPLRDPHPYTTAADIFPVVWPEPGPTPLMRPQPARDSGAGTGMLPELTDTGELRAAGNQWEHVFRAREQAWREKTRLL